MKRLHVHLAVENLQQNIEFYSTMFGAQPIVQHDDYAKWMLDDPRVNFAISNRSAQIGLDHMGIQAENDEELAGIKQCLDSTQSPVETQESAACCYSSSDKHWITDPQGIAWESFHTLNEIPTFNDKKAGSDGENPFACRPAEINSSEPKKSSCCG